MRCPLHVPLGVEPEIIFTAPLERSNVKSAAQEKQKCIRGCFISDVQCDYDSKTPNLPCGYCISKGLSCSAKMNAQEFSHLGRRKRRPFRDAGPYKNLTWPEIQKGRLSDLVAFTEGHYSEKSLEEILAIVVDLVPALRSQES